MPAALASWRWASSLLGVSVLAALLWTFGPYLAPLEGSSVRLGLIVAIVAVWAGANFLFDRRRRRRDAALTEGVAAGPEPGARAAEEEAAALRERMSEALALLKKARGTKGYLYEQPWYVIIGPPGAGKTTALVNAGLRFPLAAEMGQRAVAGVGGTRLCDWWFTEDAVLIDTAGRYTTQDSDASIDRAGWEAFLGLLKRTRQRQPLNGVIVAIAVSEIAAAPREERLAHAHAVRRRVKELEEHLSIRLPIYLLLTKADLIAGFSEFFDDLDRERRAQVWGATFALAGGETGQSARFSDEFEALVERLNERLFDRLQAERSPERRALIAGFPSQVASLKEAIGEFTSEAFVGSRLDPAPMLRGFYLTSGTQEGTPIDRLTGFLARSFGIDQRRAPSLRPEQGRSYFLTRLVKEVIFGEAMLVSERPGAARRRLLLRSGAFAGIGLVFLIGGILLWQEDNRARAQIVRMEAALAAYDKVAAAAAPLDPVADGDLPHILPLLDAAQHLPYGDREGAAGPSRWWQVSLSQKEKFGAEARSIYRDALERVLLPRLIWQLEAEMRGNLGRPDFLYQATRVYLMLGNLGPLDPALVRAWMELDWHATYPGPAMAETRQRLSRHLAALLADPLPAIPLDGTLVARAQAVIANVPLANRVYSQIAPSAAAQALAPWRPSDALGPAGAGMFVRPSGAPLSDGIPGFYTARGFYDVLLPALPDAAKKTADESWVLGKSAEVNPQNSDLGHLERDVIALYEADLARHWDAMLADIDLVRWHTPEESVQNLYLLASPQSPMRALLRSAVGELTLTKPPEKPAAAQKPSGGAAQSELKGLFPGPSGSSAEPPGKEIDDRYRALRDYVGSGPGAPIDETLKAMDALRQEIAQAGGAASGTPPPMPAGGDPLLLLRAQMGAAPEPVKRWLATMISGGAQVTSGSAAKGIEQAFGASGGPAPLCKQAVPGRYPFSLGASEEIGIEDFAKLFSPTGLLNGFFNTQLSRFVDTGSRVWRVHAVDGVTPPVSPRALAQFQRAARIRDIFFSEGGATPGLRFDLTPASLDSGAKQVTLQLGDTTIRYAHGTPTTTQVLWPGPSGTVSAQLSFDPPPQGGRTGLQTSGPWALFRLFDQGSVRQAGGPDRYLVTFSVGDREASFALHAGSVLNPFTPGLLRGFSCPNL